MASGKGKSARGPNEYELLSSCATALAHHTPGKRMGHGNNVAIQNVNKT